MTAVGFNLNSQSHTLKRHNLGGIVGLLKKQLTPAPALCHLVVHVKMAAGTKREGTVLNEKSLEMKE